MKYKAFEELVLCHSSEVFSEFRACPSLQLSLQERQCGMDLGTDGSAARHHPGLAAKWVKCKIQRIKIGISKG